MLTASSKARSSQPSSSSNDQVRAIKTAKAIGLDVPRPFLAAGDEEIE
jgi:hypothetical protein